MLLVYSNLIVTLHIGWNRDGLVEGIGSASTMVQRNDPSNSRLAKFDGREAEDNVNQVQTGRKRWWKDKICDTVFYSPLRPLLCHDNVRTLQTVRMANKERLLNNLSEAGIGTWENIQSSEMKKRSTEDNYQVKLTIVTENRDYQSIEFRLEIKQMIEQLANKLSLDSNQTDSAYNTPDTSETTTTNVLPTGIDNNATTTTTNFSTATITDTTTAKNWRTTIKINANTPTASPTNYTNATKDLCRFSVMIISLKQVERRMKRQTNVTEDVEITVAMVRDGELMSTEQSIEMFTVISSLENDFARSVKTVERGSQISELSSPTTTESATEKPTGLDTCWVIVIILACLLGASLFGFVGYMVYESEMEKKARKRAKKNEDKIDPKLHTEKDRLLQENANLKRQLRNLEHRQSVGAVHGGSRHNMEDDGRVREQISSTRRIETLNSDTVGPGQFGGLTNHSYTTTDDYRTPRKAGNHPTTSNQMENTLRLPQARRKSLSPPPGTGKPGQMISETEMKKFAEYRLDVAIGNPDGFIRKAGGGRSPQQPDTKHPTNVPSLSQETADARRNVLKMKSSKSETTVQYAPISKNTQDMRNTGGRVANTVDRGVNTEKSSLTEKNVLDAMLAGGNNYLPLGNTGKRATRGSIGDAFVDPNYIRMHFKKSEVHASTQTEFTNQEQKIIKKYKALVKDLQRQLGAAKSQGRVSIDSNDGKVVPKQQNQPISQQDTSKISQQRLTVQDKSPNEAKFVVATRHFLQEIGPLLNDMGYEVVNRNNTANPEKRRSSIIELYGDLKNDPEVNKMFQFGLNLSTISRVQAIPEDETIHSIIDGYMHTGEMETGEKIMRDLNISTEQVVAVRNYIKSHAVTDLQQVAKNLPESLRISPYVTKLSIAMMHHGYI